MTHEEWRILVSAYKDGEVSPEERAQVEAHLAECAECSEALATYRYLGRAVQALPRGAPSRELWLRVREHLPSQRGRPFWRRALPLVSAAALLLVAVTLTFVIGRTLRGPAPESAQELRAQSVATSVAAAPPALPSQAPLAPAAVPQPGMTLETRTLEVSVALTPCPGSPLALDVITWSQTSDAQLVSPRLRGVLYDAEGRPIAGVTLVISGTAGWQGSVTTGHDGTFALELPEPGPYRVVLAWTEGAVLAEKAQPEIATADSVVVLPTAGSCLAPLDRALQPIILGPNDEAILTLRAH